MLRLQPPAADAPGLPAVLFLGALLLLAGGLQGIVAPAPRPWAGGQPDLLLTVVLTAALLSDAAVGVVIGFAGGLITAAVVGETVGTLLASRTLGGFAAGWFAGRLFRANPGVIVLGVFAASLLTETLYILAAPPRAAPPGVWLPAALLGSFWNALIAYPTMLALRSFGWGRGRV